MENEQLKKAKMWKLIFQAAWWTCMGLFLFAVVCYEFWAPEHPSAMAVNMVCSFLGVICLAQSFFEGRYDAFASKPVLRGKYLEKKTFAVRSTIFCGALLSLIMFANILAALKSGEFGGAWSIPGIVFFFGAFIVSRYLWEIFFLKRLGKIETA